jgi:hypothetical protein
VSRQRLPIGTFGEIGHLRAAGGRGARARYRGWDGRNLYLTKYPLSAFGNWAGEGLLKKYFARLGAAHVEEQQVDSVVAADVEGDLSAHERKAWAELTQCFDDPTGQRVLQVALGDPAGSAEELKVVRLLRHLLGEFGARGLRTAA